MARYWRRLDPTPGTLLNERVQEHVRRVYFARQHFLSEHGEYGFDERGNIYVRYGEPDERHLGAGLGYQGGRAGEFQTVIGNLGYIENESWIYFSIDRNLYFDFVERNGYYLAHSLEDALPAGGKSDLALIQDIYRSREALGGIYRQVANATSEIEAMCTTASP
jgi:GWxTD domain-containing protein